MITVRTSIYLHTSLPLIRHWFAPGLVNYKKECARLAAASDKAYQFLARGRWSSPVTPASSTTKAGRHDIAEILLKVTLIKINQIKSIYLKEISTSVCSTISFSLILSHVSLL
jgi:hypothetical protein